jgi:predicted PurR-regulated permease PerM
MIAALTAGDLAVVTVTILSVVAVVAVLFALQAVLRSLRVLTATVTQLNDEAVPVLEDLGELVQATATDLARVDVVLDRLDAVSSSVEGVSRVATAAVSSPVIKVLSLGSGTSAAARRLRERKVGGGKVR